MFAIPAHWTTAAEALAAVESVLGKLQAFLRNVARLLRVDIDRLPSPAAVGLRAQADALADTAAALHALGTAPAPFPPAALLHEARLAVEGRQRLQQQLPEALATALEAMPLEPNDADTARRRASAILPARFGRAHAPDRPCLPPGRRLAELVRAAPTELLLAVRSQVVGGAANRERPALDEAVEATLSRRSEVNGIAWMLDADAHALLTELLLHGGERPLAQLSSRWGPLLEPSSEEPSGALGLLEALGLVFVGWDRAQGDLRVVVPPTLRTMLAPISHTPTGQLVVDVRLDVPGGPVWRRLALPRSASFADLHFAIQSAFGWDSASLFEFYTDTGITEGTLAGLPSPDELGPPCPDARRVPLDPAFAAIGDSLGYLVDFRAGWTHSVTLVSRSDTPMRGQRRLLDGARAAPPPGCKGVADYARCLQIRDGRILDPVLQQVLSDWMPDAFDLDHARQHVDV